MAPTVSAGPDVAVTLPGAASLAGSVTDDGLPNPPGAVTAAWTTVSGPGTVTFADAAAAATTATFGAAGTYVLRLTGDDGALQATDEVTVTATGVLDIPVATGADDAEERSGSVSLTGPTSSSSWTGPRSRPSACASPGWPCRPGPRSPGPTCSSAWTRRRRARPA